MSQKHSHYHKDVSHLKSIDIYRLLELFDVTDQAIGHAVKKLMCAGKRGSKSFEQDVREAVDTLNRRLQMIAEDDAPRAPQMATGYRPPAPIQVQAPAPMPSVPVAHVCMPRAWTEADATHRDAGGNKYRKGQIDGRWLRWGNGTWFYASSMPGEEPEGLRPL
jgi:hypothetical protein